MPSQKQKAERAIWKRVRGFLDVPPAQEKQAEYKAIKRQVEKVATDIEFIRGFEKHQASFTEFLKTYDLNVADLNFFDHYIFATDIHFKKPKQK